MKHAYFIARTVLVNKGNVDEALGTLNNIMFREGFFEQYRRTRRYEKPTEMRRRVNYAKCKSVYAEEMNRRLSFLMRTNRPNAFPGCT